MKNSMKTILLILFFFGLYYLVDTLYFSTVRAWFFDQTKNWGMSHISSYILSGIPLYIGTLIIGKSSDFWSNLGLNKSIIKAFALSLVCTLPMFVGLAFFYELNPAIDLDAILVGVLAAGFFEELFFRGFLFGLPFQKTRLGFITSVLFGALFFGSLHLSQSTDPTELLGIFLITFIGGILFAWIYAEWNFNIWVPMFMHMLMNLAWELFNVSDNALGSLAANIFRFITVGLVIFITVRYKKKNKLAFVVNKSTLFFKSS